MRVLSDGEKTLEREWKCWKDFRKKKDIKKQVFKIFYRNSRLDGKVDVFEAMKHFTVVK